MLTFKSSGVAISIGRQIFFSSCSTLSGQFASIFQSVKTGMSHIIMVQLTFMSFAGLMFTVLVSHL